MVLVMHYTRIESLKALTAEIMCLIVVKGFFDNVVSDMLWARSIMLTSPTVATVGTSSLTLLFLLICLIRIMQWVVVEQENHSNCQIVSPGVPFEYVMDFHSTLRRSRSELVLID